MAEHMAEWGMTGVSEKYNDITLPFRDRPRDNKKSDNKKSDNKKSDNKKSDNKKSDNK
jgi:hypothetical protein